MVQENFVLDCLDIYLGQRLPDNKTAVVIPTEIAFEVRTTGTSIDPPSFRLPIGMARKLLDELTRHFQGSSDVQTLRSDYMAERKRVDLMINALIENGSSGEITVRMERE